MKVRTPTHPDRSAVIIPTVMCRLGDDCGLLLTSMCVYVWYSFALLFSYLALFLIFSTCSQPMPVCIQSYPYQIKQIILV